MRNWTIVAAFVVSAGVAAVVVATSSTAVSAQQKGKGTLTALDYAEIQQLYNRYNYGMDTHGDNGMMWAGTFTKDGMFESGGKQYVGREALLAFAHGVAKSLNGAPHRFATNIMIEPSADGATGSAYFLIVPTPGPNKPAAITSTGVYQDVIVRTAEGWRFKKRTFYPNAFPPAMIGQVSGQ